jgi:hypothetical protein
MSGGLAPSIEGRAGPTLEQLIGRNLKNWKPFSTNADFKDALEDWLSYEIDAHQGDPTRCKASAAYTLTTQSFIDKVGHRQAYLYHTAAFKAASKIPPQYSPILNGPIFALGYMQFIQPHLGRDGQHKGTSSSSSSHKRQSSNPARGTAKRNRANEPCETHPGGSHTNGECRTQQANKRSASGKKPAASGDD